MAEILFGVVYRAVVAGCNGGCGYGSERGFGYGFGDYGGSEYGDGLGYGFGVFGNCYTDGSGEGWCATVQGFGHGSAKQRKSQ